MFAVKIAFMSGPDDGLEVTLDNSKRIGHEVDGGWEFVIGRGDTCDLVIPFDTQASRQRCFLQLKNNGLWLRDNGSKNGTFLGDHRIDKVVKLEAKQLFRVGYTWLSVEDWNIE